MSRLALTTLAAAALLGAAAITPVHAAPLPPPEVGFIQTDADLTLRRLVIRNPDAKGTILLLHGFPETIHAWDAVAQGLSQEFEVHAFDWPGFGLSSRPPVERFAYAPRDYARVLRAYIDKAGIDRTKLTIYATDIGALPALLAALQEPGIARTIIVGDFAPFDRPAHIYPGLQALKTPATAAAVRAQFNAGRDEILANTFTRGLPDAAKYEVSAAFRADAARGWDAGGMTSADAFAHYYAGFTRDQQQFEADIDKLGTPVKVVWGAADLYIAPAMGQDFARRTGAQLQVLPGIGHFPHLQAPQVTVQHIRAAAR